MTSSRPVEYTCQVLGWTLFYTLASAVGGAFELARLKEIGENWSRMQRSYIQVHSAVWLRRLFYHLTSEVIQV